MSEVTRNRAAAVAARALAVSLGVLWGFFVAFNVVFSDIFGLAERIGAIAYVLVAYAVLGLAFGAAGPRTGWRWALWLAPPGVLAVVPVVFDAPALVLYHAAVILAVAAGSAGGSAAGAAARRTLDRMRARRRAG